MSNVTIREVCLEKIAAGELVNKDTEQPVTIEDIDAILGDVRALTEGGTPGRGAGSGG